MGEPKYQKRVEFFREEKLLKFVRQILGVFLADRKGFEPSIFSVTGRRVNRATPPVRVDLMGRQ